MSKTLKTMGEVLRIRGYRPRTVESYVGAAGRFLSYTPFPVNQLNQRHVHRYLVHLKDDKQAAGSTINQALFAIRFLYVNVLELPWDLERFRCHKKHRRLPVALTQDEVHALLNATENLKHRTILMTTYSAGLRVSEVTHLKVRDIDSETMRIFIRNGKGQKDRYVMLSPRLLKDLRAYWKVYRPKDWLFPGQGGAPLCATTVQRVFRRSRTIAGIDKPATPHSLRHSFAVHLLMIGTNLKYIQELLGHASIQSTLIYLKLAPESASAVQSPFEQLPVLDPASALH